MTDNYVISSFCTAVLRIDIKFSINW